MPVQKQKPDLSFEAACWEAGQCLVAGVDEVGRGPLAGPVVAAAVILPATPAIQQTLAGLTDSKQLNERYRRFYFELIQREALDYSIGVVSAPVIDRINILKATFLAMQRALNGLERVEHVLVDGNKLLPWWQGPQQALVKGDSRSLSIAAASVLAKVTRDSLMEALDLHYPGYNFSKHKGYPTVLHRSQIQQLGLSPQHRKSFCSGLAEVSI